MLFARPFPDFSNTINAWVTAFTCQWLMGKSTVNDTELPDGTVRIHYHRLIYKY